MRKTTKVAIVAQLEGFISGLGKEWDWDDFISVKIEDPELDCIRIICTDLPAKFPPEVHGAYCNDEGIAVLRTLLENLRKE
jgi:hypothetical protein